MSEMYDNGERIPCQFPCNDCTGTLEYDSESDVWVHVDPREE